ncbi:hypothetical protein HYH03_006462 [Edaphochlamys debaryana]|uniref:Uncharacterized protein n=1 Tax=Edaphochlamys debaryana TaxID=47281 RepID=A0A836C1G8_9CHLO|nr:hypothetical protein HYH03_006462 [Edaphochlamys debaryana]|eukprot:KAG2495519.1 hypothetical protein HYH03_006462 [Edaphochlamys debaryana]
MSCVRSEPGGPCSGPFPVPLRGGLPLYTPELPRLVSLDLSGNDGALNGGLPLTAWRGDWPSLQYLNVSGCGMSGSLPYDWSPLPALAVLDLSRNRLTGMLPPGLSSLSQLRWLSVAYNDGLSGTLPPAWGVGLRQLQSLDARGVCRLCGSSNMFVALSTALTDGTHVDGRCRPDECDGSWSGSPKDLGLQDVFRGVIASLAAVMGLAGIVLVVRRVRECSARGADSRRESEGGSRDGFGAVAGGGDRPFRGRSSADGADGARSQPRKKGSTANAVPLYTIEFLEDGSYKWGLEVTVPQRGRNGSRRRVMAPVRLPEPAPLSTPPPAVVEPVASSAPLPDVEAPALGPGAPSSGVAAAPSNTVRPLPTAASLATPEDLRAILAIPWPRLVAPLEPMQPEAEAETSLVPDANSADSPGRLKVLGEVLKAARPPDAVFLMPDGQTLCLGRRDRALSPAERTEGGDGPTGKGADAGIGAGSSGTGAAAGAVRADGDGAEEEGAREVDPLDIMLLFTETRAAALAAVARRAAEAAAAEASSAASSVPSGYSHATGAHSKGGCGLVDDSGSGSMSGGSSSRTGPRGGSSGSDMGASDSGSNSGDGASSGGRTPRPRAAGDVEMSGVAAGQEGAGARPTLGWSISASLEEEDGEGEEEEEERGPVRRGSTQDLQGPAPGAPREGDGRSGGDDGTQTGRAQA